MIQIDNNKNKLQDSFVCRNNIINQTVFKVKMIVYNKKFKIKQFKIKFNKNKTQF